MTFIDGLLAGAGAVALAQKVFNYRIDQAFLELLGKVKNFILSPFKSK